MVKGETTFFWTNLHQRKVIAARGAPLIEKLYGFMSEHKNEIDPKLWENLDRVTEDGFHTIIDVLHQGGVMGRQGLAAKAGLDSLLSTLPWGDDPRPNQRILTMSKYDFRLLGVEFDPNLQLQRKEQVTLVAPGTLAHLGYLQPNVGVVDDQKGVFYSNWSLAECAKSYMGRIMRPLNLYDLITPELLTTVIVRDIAIRYGAPTRKDLKVQWQGFRLG